MRVLPPLDNRIQQPNSIRNYGYYEEVERPDFLPKLNKGWWYWGNDIPHEEAEDADGEVAVGSEVGSQ